MAKYNQLISDYLPAFKCIGGECEDTCCAGWRVPVDEETYKKYRRVTQLPIKKQLEQNVVRQRSNHSKLGAAKMKLVNGRCSFLNEEGWCDIHSTLGESYLCRTCKVYPRIINRVNDCLEYSLTLSCPEAARLVLLNPEGIGFDYQEKIESEIDTVNFNIQIETDKPMVYQDYLNEIRYVMITILQYREESLQHRLLIMGLLCEAINQVTADQIPTILGEYLNLIETNSFNGIFDDIKPTTHRQIELGRALLEVRLKTTINSTRYLECSCQMLDGLKLDQALSLDEFEMIYNEAYQNYYEPFMQNCDYMLENYLVNYVIKNGLPIDCDDIFESYTKLIMHYLIIKLHLIGMGQANEGLTAEDVVKLIQSTTKVFEHNAVYFNDVMDLIKKNNLMTLEIMTQMIKH